MALHVQQRNVDSKFQPRPEAKILLNDVVTNCCVVSIEIELSLASFFFYIKDTTKWGGGGGLNEEKLIN